MDDSRIVQHTPDRAHFYARWGPPDDYPAGTRLEWPDGGPLLAPDPALIDGGWPGLPLAIWRVDDVRLAGPHAVGRVRGDGFTIAERLPSWRWLGPRGDELLDLIDRTVAAAPAAPDAHVPATFPTGRPAWGDLDPAAHALAHFEWLLRHRLLEAAGTRDPDAVAVWEDSGCAGQISEAYLSGRFARAEQEAIQTARAILTRANAERLGHHSQPNR